MIIIFVNLSESIDRMDDQIDVGGLDHAWLYSAPTVPDCLKWSDDNLIAVAVKNHVTILDPGRLEGPRSTITLESKASTTAATTPSGSSELTRFVPLDAWKCGSISREITHEMLKAHDPTSSIIRAIAWGPLGTAAAMASASKSSTTVSSLENSIQQSGCALSMISGDRHVKIFISPSSSSIPSLSWIEALDMTNELKLHMESVGWKDTVNYGRGVAVGGEGRGGEGEVLRLRGGGGRKAGSKMKKKKNQGPSTASSAGASNGKDVTEVTAEEEEKKGLEEGPESEQELCEPVAKKRRLSSKRVASRLVPTNVLNSDGRKEREESDEAQEEEGGKATRKGGEGEGEGEEEEALDPNVRPSDLLQLPKSFNPPHISSHSLADLLIPRPNMQWLLRLVNCLFCPTYDFHQVASSEE